MKPEMDPLMVKISPDHRQSSPSGDTFTKPKSKPTISSLQLVVASLIFLAVTLGLLSVSYPSLFSRLNLRTSSVEERYSIIIDAGSSGSRAHIFHYWIEFRKPVFNLGGKNHKKVTEKIILSKCDTEAKVDDLINKLLRKAEKEVPEILQVPCEIRLMGTAGMRLLNEEKKKEILDASKKTLKKIALNNIALAPSKYIFEDEWALIISGGDEGKYAWVAANYANGTLGGDPSETSGIVELGGASAQVAFVTRSEHVTEKDDIQKVPYGKYLYNVYSHSFLGLGQNEAHKELNNILLDIAKKSEKEVTDPCTPKDYVDQRSDSSEESRLTASVKPAGDFKNCQIETEKILRKHNDECPKGKHCSIGKVYTPDLNGDFFALASFYYTATYFKLKQTDWLYNMIPAGTKFCEKSWTTIWEEREKVPDKAEQEKKDKEQEKYLLGYCFSAAYTISMLHERLHFALEGDRIKFAMKIGGISLEWPVGALILETHKALSENYSGISRKILG